MFVAKCGSGLSPSRTLKGYNFSLGRSALLIYCFRSRDATSNREPFARRFFPASVLAEPSYENCFLLMFRFRGRKTLYYFTYVHTRAAHTIKLIKKLCAPFSVTSRGKGTAFDYDYFMSSIVSYMCIVFR